MKSVSLEGKSVIVTGGRIDRAAALLFAERGACVTVADVSSDSGEAVAAEIVSNGGQAAFVRTDVSEAGDVERVVNTATERFGGLDCVFDNAGVEGQFNYTLEGDERDFDHTVAVNPVCPGVIETPMASRVARESAGARETLETRDPQPIRHAR